MLLWIQSEHVFFVFFLDEKSSFIYFQFAMLCIYRYSVLQRLKRLFLDF